MSDLPDFAVDTSNVLYFQHVQVLSTGDLVMLVILVCMGRNSCSLDFLLLFLIAFESSFDWLDVSFSVIDNPKWHLSVNAKCRNKSSRRWSANFHHKRKKHKLTP